MLSRAASDSRWTSTISANFLPFKSYFIHGNQTSRKEHGRASGGGGTQTLFVFSQKEGILLTLQRFNGNRWRPSTEFLLKTLDNVSSNGRDTRIAASSRRGSTSKGTEVSNLYKYFKYFFLNSGNFWVPHVCVYIHICTHQTQNRGHATTSQWPGPSLYFKAVMPMKQSYES